MFTMKLDRFQRTVLLNQYRILDKLDPAGSWSEKAAILEDGWEGEFDDCLSRSDHEMLSEEGCDEVLDIMSMFRALNHAKSKQQFVGFDGNHEGKQLGYVRHLWAERKFEESQLTAHDKGNSHMPMLETYRRMVDIWKPMKKYPLDPEDVSKIEAAARVAR